MSQTSTCPPVMWFSYRPSNNERSRELKTANASHAKHVTVIQPESRYISYTSCFYLRSCTALISIIFIKYIFVAALFKVNVLVMLIKHCFWANPSPALLSCSLASCLVFSRGRESWQITPQSYQMHAKKRNYIVLSTKITYILYIPSASICIDILILCRNTN